MVPLRSAANLRESVNRGCKLRDVPARKYPMSTTRTECRASITSGPIRIPDTRRHVTRTFIPPLVSLFECLDHIIICPQKISGASYRTAGLITRRESIPSSVGTGCVSFEIGLLVHRRIKIGPRFHATISEKLHDPFAPAISWTPGVRTVKSLKVCTTPSGQDASRKLVELSILSRKLRARSASRSRVCRCASSCANPRLREIRSSFH